MEELVYPVPKCYEGSKWVPYRCVIICGFRISHIEEKSSYESIHSYLILFLKCQVFNRKPINSWIKKPTPTLSNYSPKPSRFWFFFSQKKHSTENHQRIPSSFFFKVRKKTSWNLQWKHGFCPFQVRQEDHQKCPGCIKKSSNAVLTRSLPIFL